MKESTRNEVSTRIGDPAKGSRAAARRYVVDRESTQRVLPIIEYADDVNQQPAGNNPQAKREHPAPKYITRTLFSCPGIHDSPHDERSADENQDECSHVGPPDFYRETARSASFK